MSKDNEKIVEFTGNCLYREQEVKAKVQFVINEADNTFKLKAMALNDIPQSELELVGLLRSIYSIDDDNFELREDIKDNDSDQSNQDEDGKQKNL